MIAARILFPSSKLAASRADPFDNPAQDIIFSSDPKLNPTGLHSMPMAWIAGELNNRSSSDTLEGIVGIAKRRQYAGLTLFPEAGGVVARLSGLYGPGRSVLLDRCRSGSAVLEDGGGRWINQIHRDDAARALLLLADGDVRPGIYNVSDGTPATQRDVYGWVAAELAIPPPPVGPPSPNRKRGSSNKRVSNAKLVAAGWHPEFPSYADALPGLIAGG